MENYTTVKEFIVGREGNQPFTITGTRVSRHHCVIKTDGERFTIRDLGSTHGTSVRNEETGEFELVSADEEMAITPFTLVCLAESTQDGCTFYPYSLLHPDDYRMIFDYLRDKEDAFDTELNNLEKKVSMQKKLVFGLNLVVFLASFEYPGIHVDQETRMWMLRVVPLASTGFAAFYDATAAKRRISDRRNNFHHCPNPACSRMLKSSDIYSGSCKCMKKKKKDKNK